MPVFRVTGPDGAVYDVNAPEGATEQEAIAYIQNQQRKPKYLPETPAITPEPETTVLGHAKELAKGIPSGAIGMLESAGTGISAILPERIEKGARETLARVGKDFQTPFAAEKGYEEATSRKLGEALGSTVPFFALGPLGTPGRIAAGGLGMAAGAGEARTRAEAGGATEGERAAATGVGALIGATEVLPVFKFVESLGKPLAQGIMNKLQRAAATGGAEGLQEMASTVAQNLVEKGLYNPEAGVFTGSGESFGYGAGVGGLIQGLTDLALGRRAKGVARREQQAADQKAAEDLRVAQERYTPGETPAGPMAQGEIFTPEAAPVPTTVAPTPTEPGVVATEEAAAPTAPEAQGQLDLSTGRTVEQQIEELYAREELTAAEKELERAKLQLESDIAETDARVAQTEQAELKKPRIEALQRIIESDVQNIPKAFDKELISLGYEPGAKFTEDERRIINRAIDVKLAEPEAAPVEEVTAPQDRAAQTAALEAMIPEKGAKAAPAGQLSFPGMGKPRTAPAPAVEAAPVPAGETITADLLDQLAIPAKAPIRTRLEGTSLVDPDQRMQARAELLEFSTNPNIQAPVRQAVKNFINSDIFRVQGEMFGPRGGVLKEALPPKQKAVKETPSAVTGIEPAGAGVSPEGIGQRVAEAPARDGVTAGAKAPEGAGLVYGKRPAGRPEGRKAVPQPAVKEAPKAEAKKTPAKKGTPAAEAEANYMDVAEGKRETALRYLAGDIYLNSKFDPQTGEIKTMAYGRPGDIIPGTGGRFAKSFYESLDATEQKKVLDAVAKMREEERKANVQLDILNKMQEMDRAVQDQIKDDDLLELTKDAVAVTKPLHPYVQDLLAKGDIAGAMKAVAGTVDGAASRIAGKLADVIGDVKVKIDPKLDAAGAFDPKTNTISINPAEGMNAHTLIHEAVHAATSHVLANKNHIVTKQLTELYESVKDSLDTAYGAGSVDEFVAEAFGNPEFQAKLQAINPKGEPVTAWQRFVNTIKNFVRRMVGAEPTGLKTAFDRTDALVSSILSPSPETRDAGSLYMMSMFNKGGEWIDKLTKGRSVLPNTPNVNAYHEFFTGTIPQKAKEALRAALPLNALVDVAKKYIPKAPEIDKLINEKSAAESQRNDALHNSIMDVSRWEAKQTEEVKRAFNNTVYNSTLDQVDPSKPRSDYTGEQAKQWDALQADWKAIGAEGQAMYKMMRNTYRKMYDEILGIISSRIDSSLSDKTIAETVKGEILRKLADRGGLEPYFPLTRTGKYWLSYNAFNERTRTTEPYIEAFESARERDLAIEELKSTKGVQTDSIEKLARLNLRAFKGAPPTSFASSIIKTMETNGVDTETIEQVMRIYLDTLPESSFAQAFRARKGTLGFDVDATRAFKMKAHSISRQLSNLEYGAKLANLRDEIKEYVKQNRDQTTVDFWDELEKRIEFAMSPQVPYWSKVATSIGFNMTLGFNISSALVNLTQIPLVVMPYLGGKYGYSETARAMGRAAKIFTNSGTNRTLETYVPTESGEVKRKVKAFWSIDNYDFDTRPELKHLKALVDVAGKQGQLNRSQIYDVLDVDESDSLLSKVNAASGLVFHHGERMNRQVALVAAYELELQKLVGKGKDIKSATKEQMEQAANEAIYLTELTNGGVAAAAAPRLAQNALGKVMFMFKRYGVSMYYMMFKTAKEALKSADPEVRRQAMKQIAGIYGSSALIAGVKGVPLFGVAAMIFNMFRDDDEDDFETATRKWLGETAYKGPVNALTGLEIAGRVGLSDLIFRDQSYNKDQTAIQSLMETMGGPVFGVASRVERGLSLIGEGEVQRGVEQILPSAIGNGLKAIRYATEGTQTLRGDPVTGEVGPWNVFAQGLGFAPAEYIQQLERNAAVKKIDRTTNEERTKLLRQYYVALREGDINGAQDTLSKMMKFSAKHPGAAITGETIKNSMAQHKKTSSTMYHGITISKNMRNELMANIAEYDNGLDLFD